MMLMSNIALSSKPLPKALVLKVEFEVHLVSLKKLTIYKLEQNVVENQTHACIIYDMGADLDVKADPKGI